MLWSKRAGGIDNDYSFGVATDKKGDVFITGCFDDQTTHFGTINLYNTNSLGFDVYIAKVDTTMTIGISELIDQSILIIAPNPFASQTSLTFNEEQKNTTIKIMDVLGNEIRNTDFSGKQVVIEKGQMKPGIYFVQTIDKKKNVAIKKIVIQ